MDYTEAKLGRVFVLRLSQNEIIHQTLERFASEKQLKSALCFFLGGAEDKSKVVVGPKDGYSAKIEPMVTLLKGAHEVCGVGTIFTDEGGVPKLHMHASFGRNDNAITGCVRMGVNVWLVGEVVVLELANCSARRVKNKETGFELLQTRDST